MAVTMADITKLRALTSAGLMDCKKALAETDGDIQAAVEILRKKGQAVAAKREDRQAAEGCVLSKSTGKFAAIIALNCETDFVAQNAGFVALTQKILDAAVAAEAKTIEEVKALQLDGQTIEALVVEESGKTGEKTEISAYECIVGFNLEGVDEKVGRDVAMQVASMNPVAVDRDSVPQSVKDSELSVAIDKTKAEQVKKAVEAALKKAGFNLYIAENEEHLNEGIMKGNITEAQAEEIRQLKAKVAEEKAANLPEQMVNNIAQGRLNKFFKESCLMEQDFIQDGELTVGKYLDKVQKGLVAVDFKRVNLNQD